MSSFQYSRTDKSVKVSSLNIRGTILNKLTQILAYADKVDIVSRTLQKAKGTFLTFDRETQKVGLAVNEKKPTEQYEFDLKQQKNHLKKSHSLLWN